MVCGVRADNSFSIQFVCALAATWLMLGDHGWDKARQDVPDTSGTE